MNERKFKGIWIPKAIWTSDTLTLTEKCLLAEIDSFSDGKDDPCYASNEYFAKMFNVSVGRMANLISGLRKKGLVESTFNGERRNLYLPAPFTKSVNSPLHEKREAPFTKSVNSPLTDSVNAPPDSYIDARARSEENKVESKEERNCAAAPQAQKIPVEASQAQEAYALWIGRYNEAHPEEPYFNGTAKRRKADESAMRALVASGRTPEQIGETARRMFAAAKQAVNGKRAWWSEHCKSAFNFCERWTEITGELGPVSGSTSGTSTARPAIDDKFLKRWTRDRGPVREQFRDDSSFRAHSQAWQQWAEGKA